MTFQSFSDTTVETITAMAFKTWATSDDDAPDYFAAAMSLGSPVDAAEQIARQCRITESSKTIGANLAIRGSVDLGRHCNSPYEEVNLSVNHVYSDRDESPELFLPIPSLHSSTYGADASSEILISTNLEAAAEIADGADAEWIYAQGYFCVRVIREDGTIDQGGVDVVEELEAALESYPLLDEEAYGMQTWESAEENAADECRAVVERLAADDADVAARVLDADGEVPDDVYEVLAQTEASRDGLWEESECWPQFNDSVVREAIVEAFPLGTDPCPDTLPMFA